MNLEKIILHRFFLTFVITTCLIIALGGWFGVLDAKALEIDVVATTSSVTEQAITRQQCYTQSFRVQHYNLAGVLLRTRTSNATYPRTMFLGVSDDFYAPATTSPPNYYLTSTSTTVSTSTLTDTLYTFAPTVTIPNKNYYITFCDYSPNSSANLRVAYNNTNVNSGFKYSFNLSPNADATNADYYFISYYDPNYIVPISTTTVYELASSSNSTSSDESIAEFNTKTKTMIALLIVITIVALYDLFRRMNAGLLK